MPIDLTDDIVRDFLVEAGELLDQLGEQLIALEGQGDDRELLNAIFRGFHTIKGGAGFIGLDAMVVVCHRVEDIFNLLRQGQRLVDSRLMDVALKALDLLNHMFQEIKEGKLPDPAPAALLEELDHLARDEIRSAPALGGVGGDSNCHAEVSAVPAIDTNAPAGIESVSDEAFKVLLDSLHRKPPEGETVPAGVELANNGSNTITDDEFEALLDEIHGAKKSGNSSPRQPSEAEVTVSCAEAGDSGSARRSDDAALPRSPISPTPGQHPELPQSLTPSRSASKVSGSSHDLGGSTTLRVDTRVLDQIMNMVGELVLIRNRMVTLGTTVADNEMAKAVAGLDLVTTDIQAAMMRTRMQPIKKVFGRFPRLVRDLARSLGKEVELIMAGEDTDLDKNLVDALADPMIHLVRNAVDHGLELPQVRESAGKPRNGKITLAAEQEGDHILLRVIDDGAGIDPERLRRKAIEKGLIDSEDAPRLDERDCYNLIFSPGFSTKAEVSDVSGRGVGMDVVKTQIGQLNGTVEIDSSLGEGTQIRIRVPLTLAIVPTLTVILGGQVFAFPLVNVEEIFRLNPHHTHHVDGELMVRVRGKPLPLFYLGKWLLRDAGGVPTDRGQVVVVNVGGQLAGFVVDQLIGQEEVVIKPLGTMLQSVQGVAGATITGNGRIALVLDIPGLVGAYGHRR
jgi:two-component system chemotaxis sensor kinase CheA